MPPLSAYTSFESLLFFQSLASSESRPSSFVSISDLLRNNPFVRQNVAFNADRLSPEALEDLYTTLMQDGLESVAPPMSPTGPNGHSAAGPSAAATNSKKRKISSPRPDGLTDGVARHTRMVPELVAHLYARYKELVTKEIRLEEKRYREISDDIERLQKEAREVPSQVPQEAKSVSEPEPMDIDVKTEKPAQQPVMEVSKHPVEPSLAHRVDQPHLAPQPKQLAPQQPPLQATPVQEPPPVQRPPVAQAQQGEPPPTPQTLQQQPPSTQPIPHMQTGHPPQPPQINGKPPVSSQQPVLAPRNVPGPSNAHPVPHISPAAVPEGNAGPPRAPAVPASQPPNGSNVPAAPPVPTPPPQKSGQETSAKAPSHHPAQAQPSFQQWPLNPPVPPQTPHPPFSPYGNPQFPNKVAAGKPFPSPLPQQALKTETGKPYPGPFSPAFPATPGPRPQVQSPAPGPIGGGYETPVSAAQNLSFSELRGSRPHRPSIDTTGSLTPWKRTPRLSIPQSPGSPDRPRPEDVSPISERATSPFEPPEPAPSRRKGRPTEDKTQKTGKEKPTVSTRKKRDESTPSSRSRGRSVLSPADSTSKIKHEMPSTPAGVPDVVEPEPRSTAGRKGDERPGRGRPKRKRGASEVMEPENVHTEINRQDPTQSGQYVLSARNFPRTGAPIMNDVTMHKHASIFTKPLTERDAPGYRDLIYRPQDLKSIKSLINQGSKAVTAATEAASTPVTDGESPAPGTPSKNAVLMLPKTEDVIPPKAVVNSAQLEKELIRMFANAIMFNPIPQRGFGHAFPMTSDRGSRESTQVPEADEGGIIKDTLEMFEDVEQAVTRWRAAERTADELASKSILSLRRGSASEFNTDGADDVKGS